MKIYEVSATSNKAAASKLLSHEPEEMRIQQLLLTLLQEHPDVIAVRDISWHVLQHLQSIFEQKGYTLSMNPDWDQIEEKWRYTALSAMFISNNVTFEPLYTDIHAPTFPTTLRYVCGRLFLSPDTSIIYKSTHIPCVDEERGKLDSQLFRKHAMLKFEVEWQAKLEDSFNDSFAVSAGDFNGAPGALEGEYACQPLYDQMAFTDLINEPTFENKCLDHVFVSSALSECDGISVRARTLKDFFGTHTDHKIIEINIEESAVCSDTSDAEELEYWYGDALSNYSEDDQAEVMDGYDD